MDGLTTMLVFLCGILPLVISTMTEEGRVDQYGTLFGVTPESWWRQTGVVILHHDVTRGGVLYELEMDFRHSGRADIQVWRQEDGYDINNRKFTLQQQWSVVSTGAGTRLAVPLNGTKEGCLTVITGDRLGVYHSSNLWEFSISFRNTTDLSVWGSNSWLPASTNLTVGTVMGFGNLHYPIEFSLIYRVLSDEEFLPTPVPSTSTTAGSTQTTTPLTTSTPATSAVTPDVPMSTKASTTSYQPIITTSQMNNDVGVTTTGTQEFLPTPGPSTPTTAGLTQTTSPLTTSTPATSTVTPEVPMWTTASTTSYQPIITTSEMNNDVGVTTTGTQEFLTTPVPSTSTTAGLTQTTPPLTTSTPATSTATPEVPSSTKSSTRAYQPIITTSEGNQNVRVTATGTQVTEITTTTGALETPASIYVIGVAMGVLVLIVTAVLGALLWRYRRSNGNRYRETTNPVYNPTNNGRGVPMDSMRDSTYDSIPGSAVATIRERDHDVTDLGKWAASFT